jgi:hypothetical protein
VHADQVAPTLVAGIHLTTAPAPANPIVQIRSHETN